MYKKVQLGYFYTLFVSMVLGCILIVVGADYSEQVIWANEASETKCVVHTYEIHSKPYCLEKCWWSDVTFLILPSADHLVDKRILNNKDTSRTVLRALEDNYPINSSVTCWYKSSSGKLKLNLSINSLLFAIITLCALIIASIAIATIVVRLGIIKS